MSSGADSETRRNFNVVAVLKAQREQRLPVICMFAFALLSLLSSAKNAYMPRLLGLTGHWATAGVLLAQYCCPKKTSQNNTSY